MAYLARIQTRDSRAIALPVAGEHSYGKPGFSDLEWSVIRFARADKLWTIGTASLLRRLWNRLIGRGNPQLASPRLEALRRMAVLSWRFGFSVPSEDIAEFLSAGFSADQYELLVSSVRAASSPSVRTIAGEVLV